MDFDKPKVYGDTFISDGLVFAKNSACLFPPTLFSDSEMDQQKTMHVKCEINQPILCSFLVKCIYISFFSNSFLKSKRRYLLRKSSASSLILDPGCPFLSLFRGEEILPVTNLATNKLAMFIFPLRIIFESIRRQVRTPNLPPPS